jgi:hypothetical protein
LIVFQQRAIQPVELPCLGGVDLVNPAGGFPLSLPAAQGGTARLVDLLTLRIPGISRRKLIPSALTRTKMGYRFVERGLCIEGSGDRGCENRHGDDKRQPNQDRRQRLVGDCKAD